MTDSLSVQTKSTWHQQSPSRLYPNLPRSVLPLSVEFKVMTQIISHYHLTLGHSFPILVLGLCI
jgi:hypothetical protein